MSNGTSEIVRVIFLFCFFSGGMFQREMYVIPFIQTYLWYLFQAFAALFRKRELICTNNKHDHEAKLSSPKFFPFNQTVNRPVCPCKIVNNQQLCKCVIKPAKNSGLNGIRTQNLCETCESRSYHWSIKLNGSCSLWEFVIYAPCDQSLLLSYWVRRRKNKQEGSAWIAWSPCSLRSPSFWTGQSCFLSSNWSVPSVSIGLLINRQSSLSPLYQAQG